MKRSLFAELERRNVSGCTPEQLAQIEVEVAQPQADVGPVVQMHVQQKQ